MSYPTQLRIVAIVILPILPAFCADWNPKLAEQYLDARQKAWVEWPHALESGVACVSCHTGLPYLMARPQLRRTLGESSPTLYEDVLVAGIRATVIRTDAKDLFKGLKGRIVDQVYGAQVIVSALVLAMDDAQRGHMSPEGEKALDRMWTIQLHDGPDKGAWLWSDFDLDPWETKDAAYYGAALAALATGIAPDGYQARPAIRSNVAELQAYLREARAAQPLHNQLFLLWAAAKLHGTLTASDRQAILDETWKKQDADGGWALASLGPWKQRPSAPPTSGSNSYSTAVAAFTIQEAGVARSNQSLGRALDWLRSHQDPESGRWTSDSMNHKHDPGSMTELFMSDAATGYATAALLAGERTPAHHAIRPTASLQGSH